MAATHLQRKSFNRSSLVGGVVEYSARKLIYFVLLQLVLSSFVLITADTLNGSQNSNNNSSSTSSKRKKGNLIGEDVFAQASSSKLPELIPWQQSSSRFGCAANTITDGTLNGTKIKCTGDDGGVLTAEQPFNGTQGKTTKENSILWHSDANAVRPFPDDDNNNLSLTGNASIRNQSRQTINTTTTTTILIPSSHMEQQRRGLRQNFNEPTTDGTFNKDDERRVLSRKRRYLIFPPGSSLQIVYDTYHPIVDHSNLLILGITAAMAWELPSKPVNLDEHLHGSYEMEELQRIDKNVTNAPQYAFPSNADSKIVNRIDANGYYTNTPEQKISYGKQNQYPLPYKSYGITSNSAWPSRNKLPNYVMYADSLMNQFKRLTKTIPPNRPFSPTSLQEFANILTKNTKTQRNPNRRHQQNNYNRIVHPAFKKRSIDKMTSLKKFDLNLHRNSRHALYKQINMFLKTQGSDGSECILKMLCETGQRRIDAEPGSMVIELLRTLFTLPEPIEPAEKLEHRMYDEAHATIDDCQQLYPKCIESVWNSKYM